MTISSERTRLVRVRMSPPDDGLALSSRDGDQSQVVVRCNRWRKAFRDASVAYPASVLSIPLAANWIREHGCQVNAPSPQGIAFTMSARISPAHVMFHCHGATGPTISRAIGLRIGQLIVDSESATVMVGACAEEPQHVLVEVTDDKTDGLVAAVLAEVPLTLTGLYREAERPEDAVFPMLEHIADVRRRHGILLRRIAVAMRGEPTSPEQLAEDIRDVIEDGCARLRLPRPALTVFPNRIALTRDLVRRARRQGCT
jgi:diaminopimelate decarboxylase